jgi:DNA modification methylase
VSVRIIEGDCRNVLPSLGAESFDCIVTSPPYWGLRDYGTDAQIGLEPTMTEYLETMVAVFRELRRVLKPSGTFWLNIGDSYAGGGRGGDPADSSFRKQATNAGSLVKPTALAASGLKAKDLCMIPNRLAIMLQDDGWYVRSEIIWHKPNPMPESVTDRPTCAHEKVWLLTRCSNYFYNAKAIEEIAVASSLGEIDGGAQRARDGSNANRGRNYRDGKQSATAGASIGSSVRRMDGFNERWDAREALVPALTRNARNVWSIASQPFKGSHFATMPVDLAERCIRAGSPEGGHILDPFGGAGTTGLAADRLGRDVTLIELNPSYAALAEARIVGDAPLLATVTA